MFAAFDLSGLVAVLIGSVLTLAGVVYKQHRDEKAARRLTSGTIATTESGVLWEASEHLRQQMATTIERLTLRVEKLETEVERLRKLLRDEEAKNGRH